LDALMISEIALALLLVIWRGLDDYELPSALQT